MFSALGKCSFVASQDHDSLPYKTIFVKYLFTVLIHYQNTYRYSKFVNLELKIKLSKARCANCDYYRNGNVGHYSNTANPHRVRCKRRKENLANACSIQILNLQKTL
jgi:hypothetical protein